MSMRSLVVVSTPRQMATLVADAVEEALTIRGQPVIGLATGSSPLPAYRELITRHRRTPLPVASAWWTLADEYVGLPADHPQRYRHVITRELLGPLGVPAERLVVPDVDAPDLDLAAAAFEQRLVDLGGVDLQVLGVGANGHVAFAEPGTPLTSRAQVVRLAERTRRDNARFFASAEEVPALAVTQGLGTLLDAGRLVVIALGTAKRAAVEAAVCGPLDPSCPASVLRCHHHVTVVVDEAARGHWELPTGWEHVVATDGPAP